VPDGALIGADGTTSSDPHLLYGDFTPTGPRDHSKGKGAIRAFGDHKGSGLAFMCEILGGALSGTGATDPKRGRFANGMLSLLRRSQGVRSRGLLPAGHRAICCLREELQACDG
jgi:hydroxycarboxylate dehydrogenase B